MKSSSVNMAQGGVSASEIFGRFETMKEYVSIYVPSTVQVDRPINNELFVNAVQHEMSKIFGGSSTMEVNGTYLAKNGELVAERVTMVKSFAKEITAEMASQIIALAQYLKQAMGQESVAVEYNGQMVFV